MKVYIAKWHWTDGYEYMDGILGVYSNKGAATRAGKRYIKRRDEYTRYEVTEEEVLDE